MQFFRRKERGVIKTLRKLCYVNRKYRTIIPRGHSTFSLASNASNGEKRVCNVLIFSYKNNEGGVSIF